MDDMGRSDFRDESQPRWRDLPACVLSFRCHLVAFIVTLQRGGKGGCKHPQGPSGAVSLSQTWVHTYTPPTMAAAVLTAL